MVWANLLLLFHPSEGVTDLARKPPIVSFAGMIFCLTCFKNTKICRTSQRLNSAPLGGGMITGDLLKMAVLKKGTHFLRPVFNLSFFCN
jgi:hypothetical protein